MWKTVDAMIMISSIAIAELGSDTGYWVHGKPQRQVLGGHVRRW